MKLVATRKPDQNVAAIDPWTVVHFATGLALGLMAVPRPRAFGAAMGYELAEQVFERYEWGKEFFQTSGPETLQNALVDTAVFMAGHKLGEIWNRT